MTDCRVVQITSAPKPARLLVAEDTDGQQHRLPIVGLVLVEHVDEPGATPERHVEWLLLTPSGYPDAESFVMDEWQWRRVEVVAL